MFNLETLKIKNLEHYLGIETNAEELRTTNGGLLPIVVCVVVIGCSAVAGAAAVGIFAAGA
ncbi:class IIb bacteriocin, lactobin A/cerein 7B family [Maribacter sp. 2307ULW6-5]|uniref:class IIb bacteriocin, lactobin A/cerein 7B family n=1 Tax=Maribacter sp. 2307ULW6-5 TaxID=3386275 RepID=UPI0039BC5EDC